jgi:hypothetical protein
MGMLADINQLNTVAPGPQHVCLRTMFVAGPVERAGRIISAAVRRSVYQGAYVADEMSTIELVCTLPEVYAVIEDAARAGPETDHDLWAACGIVGPQHCPHRPVGWPDCPER